MRPSDPQPPIAERDASSLVEDLCLALRDVGVWDLGLTTSERGLDVLRRVQGIAGELQRRGVSIDERLRALDAQTGWDMSRLLEECRAFPSVRPRVRDLDGVRLAFRCAACSKSEFPEGDTRFLLCDGCLQALRDALDAPHDVPNIFLFRTFSAAERCVHADSETVLGVYPWHGGDIEFPGGACLRCVDEEMKRRRTCRPEAIP